jgi:uncharacterized repeat protein (TIGR03806 family)
MKITNTLGAALIAFSILAPSGNLAAAPAVLTYHNDNARTGANTNETLLTLANVNTNTFGLLLKYPVDGYVYTQPLFVPGLAIPGQGVHNAVFVATENNSVYAFDADSDAGANGGVLWHASFGEGVDVTTNHEFGGRYHNNVLQDMLPKVGITGTPVIDPASSTLYVVALKREVTETATNFIQYLHALNITTGAEQPYSPVVVAATFPGTGLDSVNGVVTFNAKQQNERCALTLAGGKLYIAYSSYADTDPYHGWIIGYNASNLQPLTNYVFNTTPNATKKVFGPHAAEGSLWMGGGGLCVDVNNNLFFEVGNGSFSADTGGGDYGDSFMKLSTSNGQLTMSDYFTPHNQAALQAADADLGSGGPMLLPDEVGSPAHPHLIVGGGKEGKIYLVDRDDMGHYNSTNDNQIVRSFTTGLGKFFCTPAYFNYQLYYQGIGGVMKAFAITNGMIATTTTSASKTAFNGFGTTPSISANGISNAIVWAIQSDGAVRGGPAVLHAYNATNLAEQLYSSSQLLWRDNPGAAVKMTVPTVVNGKVFVGAQNALAIFGNGIFLPPPAISPDGGSFANSVTVTLSDATPDTTIYYALDGSRPTTNSMLYTAPFVITNTLGIQAIAVKAGAVNSGMTSASFVNTAAPGHGTGLSGQYWTNASSATITTPPAIARIDPVLNFNWTNAGSDMAIGSTGFRSLWSGMVQAQYDEPYAFTVVADGGVRLWLNGQLLVDDWTEHQSVITNQGSIHLNSQQFYNLQMDYFRGGTGAAVKLLWSSPSTAQSIIPLTQLYSDTNPPPTIALVRPAGGDSYIAEASVTIGADAEALHNSIGKVDFYAGGDLLGTLTNSIYAPVYAMTATGLGAGNYALTAVATDGSGLSSTSAPVNLTVKAGSGKPYGLTTNGMVPAFLNMPATFNGTLPPLLSGTGIFGNTPDRRPAGGLIPYLPNMPSWSDGAVKNYYLAVPNSGGLITPDEQIRPYPTNAWKFPAGTVFVKNFDLVVDEANPNVPRRRLETQILVRDSNGGVYGVTYKWRADNSDADLLATGASETIAITNAGGVRTQNWTYSSPADCLTCHTPVAGYVLGVNTRQLNGNFTYPATGITDNQIRTLNRLGLFSPAINEANLPKLAKLSSLSDSSASLEQRARSYLDANCAECHRPGGIGNYDARYDTPLASQHLVNFPASVTLGFDNVRMIAPGDLQRSIIYDRMNTNAPTIKMPPLARNRVDANAVQLMADWINSLSDVPK